MNGLIKIVESQEKSGLLIDGVTETVKHEIKKQEGGFLGVMMAPMAAILKAPKASSLIQPVASLLINASRFLPLLALPLMMKVLGKAEGLEVDIIT